MDAEAEREARWEQRRLETQKKLRRDVEGKRFRLTRICTCVSDGWGCCCSRPLTVVADPEGDYVVVPYKG